MLVLAKNNGARAPAEHKSEFYIHAIKQKSLRIENDI